MDIKTRVKNLVKKYDTHNPYELAKDLGISIIKLDLPQNTRGFLVKALRKKYIVVNSNLSERNQKIIICHELGHFCLHKGYGYHYPVLGNYISKSRL